MPIDGETDGRPDGGTDGGESGASEDAESAATTGASQPTPMRVLPRRRTRQQLAEAPAKLATTLLSVATAGMLDAGRFRRGREYATNGSVTELLVRPGSVRGTVQGSRREPYVVDVHTEPAAGVTSGGISSGMSSGGSGSRLGGGPASRLSGDIAPAQLAGLAPSADELAARCTCPDADDGMVCKHAAAVLLALAEEIGDRPELLVLWRFGDARARVRATIGSRRGPAAPTVKLQPKPAPSPFASPAWQEFFDAPSALPADEPAPAHGAPELPSAEGLSTDRPTERPDTERLGTERLGQIDLSELVRSARAALRRATRG